MATAERTVEEIAAELRAGGCVFAEDEAAHLVESATDAAMLTALVQRRVAGEPLQHVVGWAEFRGLRIAVGPGVFIPRPRTELLARTAIERTPARAVVVDLCCGAAALGLAIHAARPGIELHVADIDDTAIRCARGNVGMFGAVHAGDLFDALPGPLRGRIDVLVANVPYVPTGDIATMPVEAREHEPMVSLDGGSDGLDLARRVAAGAPAWLAPGGVLLIESSRAQSPELECVFARAGLEASVVCDHDLDATVVVGVLTR